MIESHALRRILDVDHTGASTWLNSPATFVIVSGTNPASTGLPSGWAGVRTLDFKSAEQVRQVLASGVPDQAGAVLYDNEAWQFTPPQEQHDPGASEAAAARIAHAHNLLLIAAPAVDLTSVLEPSTQDRYASYLRLQLAAQAARYADVVDIQAQRLEADPSAFATFVAAAAAQARAANPSVRVYAGLTTSGPGVSPEVLVAAVRATRTTVAGYWLNVPGQSAECPDCASPRPELAAAFLDELVSSFAAGTP